MICRKDIGLLPEEHDRKLHGSHAHFRMRVLDEHEDAPIRKAAPANEKFPDGVSGQTLQVSSELTQQLGEA
jgi:hypothetical protein